MEEITTRFEIVRLAVKMADHETIAVQATKLRDISLDEDLNEIIALLETKNYRQALFLMKGYVNSLDDSFFDEPTPAPAPKKRKVQEAPQETQSLFDMMQPPVNKTINLDDMLRMTEESAEETIEHLAPERVAESYITQAKEEVEKNEAYLDIHKNRAENKIVKPFESSQEEELADMYGEVVTVQSTAPIEEKLPEPEPEVPEKIEETVVEETVDETVAEAATEERMTETATEEIENSEVADTFVEAEAPEVTEPKAVVSEEAAMEESEKEVALDEEVLFGQEKVAETEETFAETSIKEPDEVLSTEPMTVETVPESVETPLASVTPVVKEIDTPQKSLVEPEAEERALKAKRKADYTKENRRYPPISYIDQKFRNMRHQFPQVEESEEGIIEEVKTLLRQVATQGYTENDIRDAILFFQEKKAEGRMAEAAQMLLLAAASESKYAQLLLARELFKGEVLKVDYPESFTQINRLAEHDYPEAICDLAQLYEYGYGIKKDKKTAQLLYEEAAEMGVERAQKHVERLSSKKGILSAFFK